MNLLSKSNVHAENKLFATVDSTIRKVVINMSYLSFYPTLWVLSANSAPPH